MYQWLYVETILERADRVHAYIRASPMCTGISARTNGVAQESGCCFMQAFDTSSVQSFTSLPVRTVDHRTRQRRGIQAHQAYTLSLSPSPSLSPSLSLRPSKPCRVFLVKRLQLPARAFKLSTGAGAGAGARAGARRARSCVRSVRRSALRLLLGGTVHCAAAAAGATAAA